MKTDKENNVLLKVKITFNKNINIQDILKDNFMLSRYLDSFIQTSDGYFISPGQIKNNKVSIADIHNCLLDWSVNEHHEAEPIFKEGGFKFEYKLLCYTTF